MSKEPVKHDEQAEHRGMQPEQRADIENADNEIERKRREDPAFIEHTRPEDPSGRPGQLTRDNVNPNIPSGKLGEPYNSGGIVDPNSLGMPQGGKAPTAPMQPEHPTNASPEDQRRRQEERSKSEGGGKSIPEGQSTEQDQLPRSESINEPPGSNVYDKQVPEGLGKPVISSIEPSECAIGDPDFTLDVTGENFFAGSIIFFAGHDEPTTWNEEEKTLSTGVKPSLWSAPAVVQCQVKNGSVLSDPVDFTFLAAGETRATDPDDLEEELDEAIDSGEAKRISAVKPKRKR